MRRKIERLKERRCTPCAAGSHLQFHGSLGCMRYVGAWICVCIEPGSYQSRIQQVVLGHARQDYLRSHVVG
jgi:hypothetical protein